MDYINECGVCIFNGSVLDNQTVCLLFNGLLSTQCSLHIGHKTLSSVWGGCTLAAYTVLQVESICVFSPRTENVQVICMSELFGRVAVSVETSERFLANVALKCVLF